MNGDRVAFVASRSPVAQTAQTVLQERYGHTSPEEAEVIVALGGDGFMLQCLHRYMERGVPIYGMNRGSVGFLMNSYADDGLLECLDRAKHIALRPLRMTAHLGNGDTVEAPTRQAQDPKPKTAGWS